jgi:DNA polymerase-3 subunit epsilon
MLAEVYLELRGGREQKLALEAVAEEALEEAAGVRFEAIVRRERRPRPLPSLLNRQEIEAHAVLVSGLGEEALWNKWSP